MECLVIQDELLTYHFASLEDGRRDAVDQHLLGCAACLSAYLLLKRQLDRAPAFVDATPSPAARQRLRAAVAAAFPAQRTPWQARLAQGLRRPIPLYTGVFAAAVALLLAMAVPPLLSSWRAPAPLGPGQPVDSARHTPDNVRIY